MNLLNFGYYHGLDYNIIPRKNTSLHVPRFQIPKMKDHQILGLRHKCNTLGKLIFIFDALKPLMNQFRGHQRNRVGKGSPNCSTTLPTYGLMKKPFEVVIAILLPLRNTQYPLQQISLGLDENLLPLQTYPKVGYKIKLNSDCVKVALIKWGITKNMEE
ncbi:hypothetical protein LOD99_5207 [Oopsacas minuta]|uniref:Uncharacterized protein n=1 Tax=Oopsacas minuta TaxID=111878 RepID=A0AAV7JSK7_9METZ|nr:hypothetical protein LOD99_5207 [Oopsacas minuta]